MRGKTPRRTINKSTKYTFCHKYTSSVSLFKNHQVINVGYVSVDMWTSRKQRLNPPWPSLILKSSLLLTDCFMAVNSAGLSKNQFGPQLRVSTAPLLCARATLQKPSQVSDGCSQTPRLWTRDDRSQGQLAPEHPGQWSEVRGSTDKF